MPVFFGLRPKKTGITTLKLFSAPAAQGGKDMLDKITACVPGTTTQQLLGGQRGDARDG